ncbi:MAG: DUF3168 domain-containing protein [Pseudomonadota bacterium]
MTGFVYSSALQSAVLGHLEGDLELAGMARIYDAPPVLSAADVEADYVTLGEEAVKPLTRPEDGLIAHDIDVVVHSPAHGFSRAKAVAERIDALLLSGALTVSGVRVVDIRFVKAKADRGAGVDRRRVRMTYRVVLEPALT